VTIPSTAEKRPAKTSPWQTEKKLIDESYSMVFKKTSPFYLAIWGR